MDLVTQVDKQCQDLIESAIRSAFPGHACLGEESVPPGSDASSAAIREYATREWVWVIDPIDGTTNFVQGLPASVVSIGVAHKGQVVVGVVYEPYRDELFTAVRGQGAKLNGRPIAVAPETELGRAVFAYGLHHTRRVSRVMLAGVTAASEVTRGLRSFGSAALHLSYVACGRLTGFWELDLSSWDLAAGSLLVTEAGGKVCDTRGEPYSLLTRDMLATNGAPGVRDGILRVLADANANKL